MAGKIQKQDVKTEAELTGAGASASDLINDAQIYTSAAGINKTLDDAIVDGDVVRNDVVTNAKLANAPAWTLKGRNDAASGDPQDIALADLVEELAPATGDFLLGHLATGELRKFDFGNLPSGGGAASLNSQIFTVSDTFVVPTGVTRMFAIGCGGGGAGGAGLNGIDGSNSSSSGAGGGAGAGVEQTPIFETVPGNSLTITIASAAASATNGGNSTITGAGLAEPSTGILFPGATRGANGVLAASGTPATGGAGGAAYTSGTIRGADGVFTGANGGNTASVTSQAGATSATSNSVYGNSIGGRAGGAGGSQVGGGWGGGGGGGGANSQWGVGGIGGAGSNNTSTNGQPGAAATGYGAGGGGGGGGSEAGNRPGGAGGAGAPGRIILFWIA